MRHMEIANSEFIKRLAACAAKRVIEPPVALIAEDRENTDKAKQCAIAYYMMGFHRDEIESVLEDSGFVDPDIKLAMESLEQYAEATLKNGPFAVLEYGQLVKLNRSGSIGTLVDKRPDFITVQFDGLAAHICEKDIDMRSTAALTQAFKLRQEARESLRRVAGWDDDWGIDDAAVEEEEERAEPEQQKLDKVTKQRVRPDPDATSGKGYNWPSGVPHTDPETGEEQTVENVPLLVDQVDQALVQAIQDMIKVQREIEGDAADIEAHRKKFEESISGLREAKAENEQRLQNMAVDFLNAFEQIQDVENEEYTYVMAYLNRMVILHQKIEERKHSEPRDLAEYKDFYNNIIQWAETQPKALQTKMLQGIEEVKQQSIKQVQPVWKRILEVIWPTKEHRQAQEQGLLSRVWDTLKDLYQRSFQAVQEYFSSWENEIKPEFEQQMQQLDQFIDQVDTMDEAAQAQVAVAALLKRYK